MPPKGDTALERFMATQKGSTIYKPSQAFYATRLLARANLASSMNPLAPLSNCATAVHRDTPCTPVCFFRISSNSTSIYPSPQTIHDHPALALAQRKLRFSIPRGAVVAELARQRLGSMEKLLCLDANVLLPAELRDQKPVAVECTELYLDEQAYMEHPGSQDYLAVYGKEMDPALTWGQLVTVRVGNPTEYL